MNRMIKRMLELSALVMMTLAVSSVALADDDVIDKITLEVTSDIQVGKPCSVQDIHFTVLSDGCEVREAQLLNTSEVWGNQDIPRVTVFLRAEAGYTFSVNKSDIRVRGAECESGYFDENMFFYVLRLRLPSLREKVGETAGAYWSSPVTAAWSASANAGYYEVQLYRDGTKQGPAITTPSTSCELGTYMHSEGTYFYKVRAVNQWDTAVKSEWADSAAVTVDSAAAEQNRRQYPIPAGNSPLKGPLTDAGIQHYYQDMYGWIAEGSRWWYRNADGSYTTGGWQLIDGKWYYFDSEGYMVTGWIDWNGRSYYCDPESGDMLVNRIVPDGSGLRVDSSGALIE